MRILITKSIVLLVALIFLVIPVQTQGDSNVPPSYSWSNLRVDSVQISYSFSKVLWFGGTGYLHIKADAPGTYSDTKSTTATITVPEGFSAEVYVCGDDRTPLPTGWVVKGKYLKAYVDGKEVYKDTGYWWANCFTRVATLSPGTHKVKLEIYIRVEVSSSFGERDLHHAVLEIILRGNGNIQVSSHTAEAALDGGVEHVFTFRLPEMTGVGSVCWNATWRGFSKTGSGAPGSVQKVSFEGVNRDAWVFTSPVVIRVGEPVPSVNVTDDYVIDAVYHSGSEEAGIYRMAVALNNGDEVGYTSANYLVTEIRRDTRVFGGTLIGSAVWANSNSTILFNQTVSYYGSAGWVTEKIREGVETGFAATRVFEEVNVSRRVVFSSKNRSDELELTTMLPKLTLVFTHIKISAERSGNSVEARACWAHDGSPVAGLRIMCFETDQSSVTDLDGRVTFRIVGSSFQVTLYPADSLNGITVYEEARLRL